MAVIELTQPTLEPLCGLQLLLLSLGVRKAVSREGGGGS